MLQKRQCKGGRLTAGAMMVTGILLYPMAVSAWDQLYVFGDSLSDSGNNGRYTWDGSKHPLYNDILAEKIN